jgi:hypothetical protein
VASASLYGGTITQLDVTMRRFGIDTTFVASDDPADFAAAIKPNTKAIFAEVVSNPASLVADIRGLADVAHAANIPLVVDATTVTPYLCRPIEHGADIVIHSATKYLGVHGTTMSGVIVDAGGGLGALAQKIKASNPKLDVVVLERPEVCELAAKLGMAGDIKWEAGDFARPWPILADVITMSRVLHDWDDLKCLEILTYAKSSLKAGGRIIIIETVLTEEGWHGGLCDLHLLAVSGGKERTLSDFVEMCGSVGLTVVDILDASSLHKALHFKQSSR